MTEKDRIFKQFDAGTGSFRFDDQVARVFPDMIGRSVPGYGLIVPMIGQLAERFAVPDTFIHDLGCSLGAVTLAMRRSVTAAGVHIIATDSSAAMVEGLTKILAGEGPGIPVEIVQGDIRDTSFENSSFIALNFTLQFIDPADRPDLLGRMAEGLSPGGALILSEKIRFDDEYEQARQTDWHHDFKRAQGYSELEIARKRTALEKVLEPETEAMHFERLRKAGFRRITRWFQCFGFCSFLAER